jgi:hypothetical protein
VPALALKTPDDLDAAAALVAEHGRADENSDSTVGSPR